MKKSLKRKLEEKFSSLANRLKKVEESILSSNSIILPIDKSIQLDSYSCGAHSLHILLKYFKEDIEFEDLKKQLKTNADDGTEEEKIYEFLRSRGIRYEMVENISVEDLRRAISEGNSPVLTTVEKESHYVVVYGYRCSKDSKIEGFFVANSSPKDSWYSYVPISDFSRIWDKWFLQIVEN